MSGRGKAMMGSAVASGDNRATEAVEKALSSPLLDNMHLKNATGVLCNITAGADLKQSEFNLIGQKVKEIAGEDATTIIGCIKEDENVGELRVTLIATGFDNNEELSIDDDNDNYQNPNNFQSGISTTNINKTFTSNPLNNTNILSTEEPIIENDKINVNDVEVPAFLRQQAD
jgi:cell division protein FtsZ